MEGTSSSPMPPALSDLLRGDAEYGSDPHHDHLDFKAYFQEFSRYLAGYPLEAAASTRSSSREKLTRLTVSHFHELSTDVYDEVLRRVNKPEVFYLHPNLAFHPKRNQARQKLSCLRTIHMQGICSDVHHELSRRYPGFKDAPQLPSSLEHRVKFKTHFQELSRFLAEYLLAEKCSSPSSARQKLVQLNIQQFLELSTDVYDEVRRRVNEPEVLYLCLNESYHPKRNQARQKLAILLTTQMQYLCSDVHYELSRRFPEFNQGHGLPQN